MAPNGKSQLYGHRLSESNPCNQCKLFEKTENSSAVVTDPRTLCAATITQMDYDRSGAVTVTVDMGWAFKFLPGHFLLLYREHDHDHKTKLRQQAADTQVHMDSTNDEDHSDGPSRKKQKTVVPMASFEEVPGSADSADEDSNEFESTLEVQPPPMAGVFPLSNVPGVPGKNLVQFILPPTRDHCDACSEGGSAVAACDCGRPLSRWLREKAVVGKTTLGLSRLAAGTSIFADFPALASSWRSRSRARPLPVLFVCDEEGLVGLISMIRALCTMKCNVDLQIIIEVDSPDDLPTAEELVMMASLMRCLELTICYRKITDESQFKTDTLIACGRYYNKAVDQSVLENTLSRMAMKHAKAHTVEMQRQARDTGNPDMVQAMTKETVAANSAAAVHDLTKAIHSYVSAHADLETLTRQVLDKAGVNTVSQLHVQKKTMEDLWCGHLDCGEHRQPAESLASTSPPPAAPTAPVNTAVNA
eukprot:Clim_evm1s220 gene=Clim_evmTU1s220